MDKALSGIRIIDMTHNQAGPACTQILGFLGADVIKLEEPKGGDIARVNMRDQKNSDSLFFLILNANKRSLTLNLKTDVGKDLFRKVIAQSDVRWRISGRARSIASGSATQRWPRSTRDSFTPPSRASAPTDPTADSIVSSQSHRPWAGR